MVTPPADRDALAAALLRISDLAGQVTDLTARLDTLGRAPEDDPGAYQPCPTRRFWRLEGRDRADAVTRLRAWVEDIYRPSYGQLAAALGDCWEQHPLCLYTLDWLSELWSVLYLQPRRTASGLAGQAEWQTRLLTAAAEQMHRETARCRHAGSRPLHTARTGSRP